MCEGLGGKLRSPLSTPSESASSSPDTWQSSRAGSFRFQLFSETASSSPVPQDGCVGVGLGVQQTVHSTPTLPCLCSQGGDGRQTNSGPPRPLHHPARTCVGFCFLYILGYLLGSCSSPCSWWCWGWASLHTMSLFRLPFSSEVCLVRRCCSVGPRFFRRNALQIVVGRLCPWRRGGQSLPASPSWSTTSITATCFSH